MKAAIIIPAYEESATIRQVVEGVLPLGIPIVIDDCSTDNTAAVAKAAGAVIVRHDRNRGYDGALESGFAHAAKLDAEVVVTMDADSTHDPASVAETLARLTHGPAELVLGVRDKTARFSESLFNAYVRVRFGVADILCGVKGYRITLYTRRGYFDGGSGSVGTRLALECLRAGIEYATVRVAVGERADNSRFGSGFRANWLIMRAMMIAIRSDLAALFAR